MNTFLRSSIVSLITLSYVGYAYNNAGRPSSVPMTSIIVFVPIMYGIFGTIDAYLSVNYRADYSLFVGAALGLILSLFGHFAMNLPKDIFNYPNRSSAHIVHLYAIILYAVIFKVVVHPLNHGSVKIIH